MRIGRRFHSPSAKGVPYMANNDEYTDEYNDEYLCRDFFVGFNFWSRLSFQISEFRVHWFRMATKLLVMYGIASSMACVFIACTVQTSQSSSNSIEKRFFSLFFWNFGEGMCSGF